MSGDETAATATTYSVELRVPPDAPLEQAGQTVEIAVDSDEYVLSRAREEGIWLSADCQQGWCTTCGGRLLDGEIDQSDARRYYEVDRDAGFVLLCVAKPRSDLVVEVEQRGALLRHRAAHDLPPGSSKL
ncbi:2Fe-2S iron-sulfur cluster-binding protein [Halobellus sp. GM3]|uniref:2Fe-2S iron-sulfur cluster-binding protein n=1 Tax=Halobellus sp. GM3 TaxID=3458410 RepID=UPI00403D735B